MSDLNNILDLIDEESYIENPTDFIYSEDYDLTKENIMDILNYIVKHNKEILLKLKRKNEELQKVIDIQEKQPQQEINTSIKEPSIIKREYKDLEDKIDLLFYSFFEDDFKTKINTMSYYEIPYLKIGIQKRIKSLKETMKELLLSGNTTKIDEINNDIHIYQSIITSFTQEELPEEEVEDTYDSRIILLPNQDIYNDLLECLSTNKEITNGFKKVLSGYFLNTKDLKSIRKYDKLNEYKNANGLRVMYVTLPNNYILITKVFIKDKTKSTRIEAIYEEAYQKYLDTIEYILENINNPDLFINQSIQVGEIMNLFESIEKQKKVGV